jgi:hypothetical protein
MVSLKMIVRSFQNATNQVGGRSRTKRGENDETFRLPDTRVKVRVEMENRRFDRFGDGQLMM